MCMLGGITCSLRWGLCTQVFTSLHMGRMIVLLCVCNACANTCPAVCVQAHVRVGGKLAMNEVGCILP